VATCRLWEESWQAIFGKVFLRLEGKLICTAVSYYENAMGVPYSPAELQRLYGQRFAEMREYRNQVWQTLIEFFSRWIEPNATVLDLGCGHCEFVNNVRAGTRYGMDLNPASAQQAAPGVKILMQNCVESWALPDESLDVIFTSNFFEHLYTKQDLRETLLQAVRCLKPGGRIIALGPNIRYLAGTYWDFYDHYLPLTERSLGEVMTDIGLTVEEQTSRFLPYTMSLGKQLPVWMLRLYLKLRFAWPLFGKQFLVVAKK
jgi:SAM-dependent methyltransferase